jgi:hypothetical protein
LMFLRCERKVPTQPSHASLLPLRNFLTEPTTQPFKNSTFAQEKRRDKFIYLFIFNIRLYHWVLFYLIVSLFKDWPKC